MVRNKVIRRRPGAGDRETLGRSTTCGVIIGEHQRGSIPLELKGAVDFIAVANDNRQGAAYKSLVGKEQQGMTQRQTTIRLDPVK